MYRKNFLKLSTASLVIVGLLLLFGPRHWFPGFYYPLYFGITALLSPLLIYLPPFILKGENNKKRELILNLQVIIGFSLLINISGQLGLYQLYRFGFEYDKFAHFLVCMLFAFSFGEILKEWVHLPPIKIVFLMILSLFFAGLAWEVFEAGSDLLFATQEWGVNGMYVVSDTYKDIGFNVLGSIAGIFISLIPKR